MKYFLSLLAAMIVACSLLGCHKKNADNTERYYGLNYAVLWETLYGANYPTHL